MTLNPSTTATFANIDIESIVRLVLHRIQDHPNLDRGHSSETSITDTPLITDTPIIDQNVLTLEDLKNISVTKTQILVSSRCVVTPAVKDELRNRGIEVVRVPSPSTSSTDVNSPAKSNATAQRKSPFRRIRLTHDASVEKNLYGSVEKQLVTRGIRLCDESSIGVVLSSRPAVAVYESIAANTSAVLISRIEDISRFRAELRPSVFVLDVQHLSLLALVNSAITIAQRGERHWTGVPKITVAGGQR